MAKPELETIFTYGGEHIDDQNANIRLQYDKKTNELYVNDRKVVTEINFKIGEKILAWIVAGSIFVQALMSVLTYFIR
jgi:hypothetical protein